MLRSLKIQQSCVLDVQFPAKNRLALLVHKDFHDDLVSQLKAQGLSPLMNFDPLAADAVGDKKYANDPVADREKVAKKLFAERMMITCLRLPRSIGYSVAHAFVKRTDSLQMTNNWWNTFLKSKSVNGYLQQKTNNTAMDLISTTTTDPRADSQDDSQDDSKDDAMKV